MIVGHFATALVATEKAPKAPFWWLLVASNIADFVMVVLVAIGIETMVPSSMFEATLENLRVDMTYTHDLLPALLWTLGVGAIGYGLTRDTTTAIWSAVLVAFHEICDLVSGFYHYVFTPGSPRVGLALLHPRARGCPCHRGRAWRRLRLVLRAFERSPWDGGVRLGQALALCARDPGSAVAASDRAHLALRLAR